MWAGPFWASIVLTLTKIKLSSYPSMHWGCFIGKLSLPVSQKLNEAMFAATCFLHLPRPPTIHSSTHLPSPSVVPSLIPGAQRLFLLSLRRARGLCVSAYVFDDEAAVLKNEADGGNLSTLERRMAAFWQREVRRRRKRHWGFFFVRLAMMKWMRFLLRCIK